MAYLNVKERVIEAKIVYYGAGLSGKTTNLERIKGHSEGGKCGEMMSLDTDGDRTLFFDWLPYNVGKFNGCDVRVQLYTVPGQTKYGETRKKVLAGADGVVLVLDSEAAAIERNRRCLVDLEDHLAANGLPKAIPLVLQLNKRDLPTAMVPEQLLAALGLAGRPHVPASATRGEGVFETLREVTRLVLASVREGAQKNGSSTRVATGAKSGLDGESLYAQLRADAPPSAPAPKSLVAEKAPPPPSAPASSPEGSFSAQLGEIIAGHRLLARRLDQLEQSIRDGSTRTAAESEKRLTARWVEHDAAMASRLTKLGEELAPLRRAIDGSAHDVGKRLDTTSAKLEALGGSTDAIDGKLRAAVALLAEISQGLSERIVSHEQFVASQVQHTVARFADVDHRLTEMTEMFAQMTDKNRKSWWR